MNISPASPSEVARKIRAHALRMVHVAKSSHIGTCLSMADLLAVLYFSVLRIDPKNPLMPDRDRFILSKGHGAAILYATLAARGFFPESDLAEYCVDGSSLTGHVNAKVPGIELSTGSLGHGLGVGCGMALAGRIEDPYRVFVLVSDGELDEGSNWEAILFAPHHRLENLTLIVDYNKIQSFGTIKEVLELEPLVAKFESFGWGVREVDGHDCKAIQDACDELPFLKGRPNVIIAHTVKGKGVTFMENQLAWHYKSPSTEQLATALQELGYSQ